jgi:two-component system nitrogen regulation response regulator NtrX
LSKKKRSFLTTILIVDDEKEICKALKGLLSDEGYRVLVAHTPEEASSIIASETPQLLLLDVWFGKGSWDGVYFLDRVQLSHPSIPIIMISGHATLSLAVSALQKGAYDFLEKPISVDRLLLSVKRALEFKHIQSRLVAHRELGPWEWPLPIDGKLKKLATSDARILLLGEKGVGKTRLAKYLHILSPRHEGPLVVAGSVMLNALDDASFFGVQSLGRIQKYGFFEQAQGGTIILSNIHCLRPERQVALAQLFQSGTIKRLGGDQAIPLNVRFIATSLPDFIGQALEAESQGPASKVFSTAAAETHSQVLASEKFRKDKECERSKNSPNSLSSTLCWTTDRSFYDRITLAPFTLDSLRKNIALIPLWANALLQELAQDHDIPTPILSESALTHLKTFDWPGNMEQLQNVLQRIIMETSAPIIEPKHLPRDIVSHDVSAVVQTLNLPKNIYSLPLKEARARFEMSYVKAQLVASEGSMTKAAEIIGMERSALHRKLKTLSNRAHAPPIF